MNFEQRLVLRSVCQLRTASVGRRTAADIEIFWAKVIIIFYFVENYKYKMRLMTSYITILFHGL